MVVWKFIVSKESLSKDYPTKACQVWREQNCFGFGGYLGTEEEAQIVTIGQWGRTLGARYLNRVQPGNKKVLLKEENLEKMVNVAKNLTAGDLVVVCENGSYYIGKTIQKEGRTWHYVSNAQFDLFGTHFVAYVDKFYSLGLADSVPNIVAKGLKEGEPVVRVREVESRRYLIMRYDQMAGASQQKIREAIHKAWERLSLEFMRELIGHFLQKERGLICQINVLRSNAVDYDAIFYEPGKRYVLLTSKDEVSPFALDRLRDMAIDENYPTQALIYDKRSQPYFKNEIIHDLKTPEFTIEYLAGGFLKDYWRHNISSLPPHLQCFYPDIAYKHH